MRKAYRLAVGAVLAVLGATVGRGDDQPAGSPSGSSWPEPWTKPGVGLQKSVDGWRRIVIKPPPGAGSPDFIYEMGSPDWKRENEERSRERARRAAEYERRQKQGPGFIGTPPELRPIPDDPTPPPYKGTLIYLDPKADDATLEVVAAFAAAMRDGDPQPASRALHFAWLPYFGWTFPVGWWGVVQKVEEIPAGRLITVRFTPYLCSYSLRHSHVNDYVDETYSLGAGGLDLISTDAETARPDKQVFPVAF